MPLDDLATDASSPAHPGRLTLGSKRARGWPPMTARVAQYPDCQQLQLWLPPAGAAGWTRLQLRLADGTPWLDVDVQDQLQAGTRLTLDTLPWPPGALQLSIDHADGGQLQLDLHKAADPDRPLLPQPAALADDQADLRWRERVLQALAGQLARGVVLRPQGRDLQAHYHDGDRRLVFDVEVGSDRRPMRMTVPASPQWEARTGLPLAQRDEVLAFVAARVAAAGGGPRSWTLHADAVDFG